MTCHICLQKYVRIVHHASSGNGLDDGLWFCFSGGGWSSNHGEVSIQNACKEMFWRSPMEIKAYIAKSNTQGCQQPDGLWTCPRGGSCLRCWEKMEAGGRSRFSGIRERRCLWGERGQSCSLIESQRAGRHVHRGWECKLWLCWCGRGPQSSERNWSRSNGY